MASSDGRNITICFCGCIRYGNVICVTCIVDVKCEHRLCTFFVSHIGHIGISTLIISIMGGRSSCNFFYGISADIHVSCAYHLSRCVSVCFGVNIVFCSFADTVVDCFIPYEVITSISFERSKGINIAWRKLYSPGYKLDYFSVILHQKT